MQLIQIVGPCAALLRRMLWVSVLAQFRDAREGLSLAICFTFASSSAVLNDGNEHMRLLQANAAGSPRSGYSTSGLASPPSRGSSQSRRLYLAGRARAKACSA